MKIYWKEPRAVLRFEAESDADLDLLGDLFLLGPLQGVEPHYRPLLPQDKAGLKAFMGQPRLLTGFDWPVLNRRDLGYPRTERQASIDNAVGQIAGAVTQLLRLPATE